MPWSHAPPDADACAWFTERMSRVKPFADKEGVVVQAWAVFGMDAVVWLAGTEENNARPNRTAGGH